MSEMIREFQGEFRFLSNFWPARVHLDGIVYRSVEHAYQAAKTQDEQLRAKIRNMSPGQAKRFARGFAARPDWSVLKLSVMLSLVREKFACDLVLRAKLLETYRKKLQEGNLWHDRFWGICLCPQHGDGQNHLGRILEQVRAELQRDGATATHPRIDRSATRVINIRDAQGAPNEIYVGRAGHGIPGPFGNPIAFEKLCPICSSVHRVTQRAQLLACYKVWLWKKLQEDKEFAESVARLAGKTLVCFCKPVDCHGDILAAAAKYLNERSQLTRE